MAGYYPHLRTIVGRAFTLIDSAARAKLGFGPSDALALADIHVGWHESELFDVLQASKDSGFKPAIERLIHMMARDRQATLRETSLEGVPVDLILAALTTELGSLAVDNMSAANRLRTFPVVPLPDGRYLWARPWDFLHERTTAEDAAGAAQQVNSEPSRWVSETLAYSRNLA